MVSYAGSLSLLRFRGREEEAVTGREGSGVPLCAPLHQAFGL
jgi:hypothetical protein